VDNADLHEGWTIPDIMKREVFHLFFWNTQMAGEEHEWEEGNDSTCNTDNVALLQKKHWYGSIKIYECTG